MKYSKSLVVAALAALSLGSASASVTYITGSTAFESVADKALTNFAAANFGGLVVSDGAFGSESDIVLNYSTNGSTNTATNFIIAHWSGSEAGIQAIDAPTNNTVLVNFLSTTNTGGTNGISASYATNSHNAQIAFSDTFSTASQFRAGSHAGDGRTYGSPAQDAKLAVQGFAFFGSSNIPITNITSQQVRALYANGYAALALFTGNSADQTNAIFAIGRNPDSGTRIQAQAEPGIGGVSVVSQDQIVSNTVIPYPAGSVDGITFAAGNNGYSSTGTLLAALEAVYPTGTAFDPTGIAAGDNTGSNFVVGYAAASKIGTAGTVALNYNGVAPTVANITNGLYTFWGYEHLDLSPYYADSAASNVYSNVVTYITGLTTSQLGAGNASLSDASGISRSSDGGVVTQNY